MPVFYLQSKTACEVLRIDVVHFKHISMEGGPVVDAWSVQEGDRGRGGVRIAGRVERRSGT